MRESGCSWQIIPAPVPENFSFPSIPPRVIPGLVEHLGRSPAVPGLMGSLFIVEPEVGSHFPTGVCGVGVGFQVHLLVLQRTPQPLHKDVVDVPPFPILADLQPLILQRLGELLPSELGASVGVGHFLPTLPQHLPRSVDTEVRLQSPAPTPDRGMLDSRQDTTYRLCQSTIATR